ncbi:hypothetical protein WTH01_17970 [Weissella thailandensis]|nr:hypothetical protein WTH01_17970 [Weissella thailandensis]
MRCRTIKLIGNDNRNNQRLDGEDPPLKMAANMGKQRLIKLANHK